MSKQPRKVTEALKALKAQGLVLPEERDPRQLWLVVVMHPSDGEKGCVFATHGRNFDKFSKRKGFEVIAHCWDRGKATQTCRKLTLSMGEGYQPQFSAHRTALAKPAESERSETQDVFSETPDDFLDAVGKSKDRN